MIIAKILMNKVNKYYWYKEYSDFDYLVGIII
jgi:hypothetical protein